MRTDVVVELKLRQTRSDDPPSRRTNFGEGFFWRSCKREKITPKEYTNYLEIMEEGKNETHQVNVARGWWVRVVEPSPRHSAYILPLQSIAIAKSGIFSSESSPSAGQRFAFLPPGNDPP